MPWWKPARDRDEIAPPDEYPQAETYGGRTIDEDRASPTLAKFFELFESRTGHAIEDLAFPLETHNLIDGRIEPTLLGVSRYGSRSIELAEIISKHPSSMTRRLTRASPASAKTPAFGIASTDWTIKSQQLLRNE